MEFGFTTAAYVVAAVLFILSLGGLSGQESAKRAVWYGIVGMGLAVLATLIGPGSGLWLLSVVLIAAGGGIGVYVAKKVEMTEMPQLVAAMHSLVGLAAVFVGYNAHFTMGAVAEAQAAGTDAVGTFAELVAHKSQVELNILKVELFLGIFIGAVTFTGSVVAYGKLAGKLAGGESGIITPAPPKGLGVIGEPLAPPKWRRASDVLPEPDGPAMTPSAKRGARRATGSAGSTNADSPVNS